jgi:peptidoglycan/xylan/chitin deacetylase (PgdA/CDA1 family)
MRRGEVKSLLAGTVYFSGALAGWRFLRRALGGPRVHVLGFHRVVPDFAAAAARAIPALCIASKSLDAQLEYLLAHMEPLDLAQAIEVLRGRRRLRRDAFVLTFDDGYRDLYTQALPVLSRRGLAAAAFVCTRYVGTAELLPHDRLFAALREAAAQSPAPALPHAERWADLAREHGPALAIERAARWLQTQQLSNLADELTRAYGPGEPPDDDGRPLDWEMCRKLADSGIEIGSHTTSHVALAHEPPEVIRRELAESSAEIERRLARKVRFVAYPNGVYSSEVVRACTELGFQGALTTEDRVNRAGTHPLRIGRKLVWEAHVRGLLGGTSTALFAMHLENPYGKLDLRDSAGPMEAGEPRLQVLA